MPLDGNSPIREWVGRPKTETLSENHQSNHRPRIHVGSVINVRFDITEDSAKRFSQRSKLILLSPVMLVMPVMSVMPIMPVMPVIYVMYVMYVISAMSVIKFLVIIKILRNYCTESALV